MRHERSVRWMRFVTDDEGDGRVDSLAMFDSEEDVEVPEECDGGRSFVRLVKVLCCDSS